MATRKTQEDEVVVPNGNKGDSRISFTVTPEARRNIRIAAAHDDMTPGEWIAAVLSRYAAKAVSGGE